MQALSVESGPKKGHPAAVLLDNLISKRIASDTLVVPAIPQIVNECLVMLRDPQFNAKKLATLIAKDPVIAIRLLRAANSAALGTVKVVTIDQAVARLGAQRINALCVEASAAMLFESQNPAIRDACQGIWRHSVAVAIIARDLIATGANAKDQDAAFLVGLLHDVGKPVVASYLLELEREMPREMSRWFTSSDDWLSVISTVHRKVGVLIAAKWQLPEEIVAAIGESAEYDNASRDSLANYVRFANALAKREGIFVGQCDVQDAEAVVMIGRSLLGLNDDIIAKLSDNLKERVARAA